MKISILLIVFSCLSQVCVSKLCDTHLLIHIIVSSCSNICQIHDRYADSNGTFWLLCRTKTTTDPIKISESKQKSSPVIFITSYLNTIHIRQRSVNSPLGLLNATIRVQNGTMWQMNSRLQQIDTVCFLPIK